MNDTPKPTTKPPTQIARDAADKVRRAWVDLDYLARHAWSLYAEADALALQAAAAEARGLTTIAVEKAQAVLDLEKAAAALANL